MTPRPPGSTLFPYTTLFRSVVVLEQEVAQLQPVLRPQRRPADELAAVEQRLVAALEVLDVELPVRARDLRVPAADGVVRSEEHTSELQSQSNLVCRLLLEKK